METRARPGEMAPALPGRTRPADRLLDRGPERRLVRDRLRDRPAPGSMGLLTAGLVLIGTLMALAALNVGGHVVLWENAHWTAAGLLALVIAASSVRGATGLERRLRMLVAIGTGCWFVGQLAWNLQTALGLFSVPAPSDIGFLLVGAPALAAFVLIVRDRLRRAEGAAVYLDAAAIFLAITAVILAQYGDDVASAGMPGAAVAVAYPIFQLATAGVGLVALLSVRAAPRLGGGYLLLAGFAVLGVAWVEWLRQAVVALPTAGSPMNYAFSAGIVMVGVGGANWQLEEAAGGRSSRMAAIALGALPILALVVSSLLIVTRRLGTHEIGVVDVMALAVIVLAGLRQTLLLQERGRLLESSREAREELEVALVRRADADSRYRQLVERVPAAVYIDEADPGVTDGGRPVYMSPQIEGLVGYAPDEFMGDHELWLRLIHPDDRETTVAAYRAHWKAGQPFRADYRMVARDGSEVWVHDEAFDMAGGTPGRRMSQGLLVNITDQKRLEAQLLHDALHDPLTGLANRVLFRDHVDRALGRRRRRRAGVALLFLDLDDFKVVNDSLGHRAGDRLLVEVGRRLAGAIRSGDVAARQGGDEFTVLLDPVRGVADAIAAAERLATELRHPIALEGQSLVIGISVGIALAGWPATSTDDLLAHADAAMYAAKAHGKDRHAVFDPSMRVLARRRLETEAELRSAIDQRAFELHYQPIVDIASRRITGLEALVRWRHPDGGLVRPGKFIPLAETTGLIVPLGRLVLEEATRQLRAWRDAAPGREHISISVNVSPRQAIEPGFATEVREILKAAGLEPSSLVLEITESLTLQESAISNGSLRHLHDLGVQIEIDDFGTGFSALEYFKRFAVHGLKIDHSFIAGLGRSREDTAIVTATLAFASALDLRVTAEGVETADQLAQLQALGCQRAQGFLFSRAVPAEEVPGLLDAGPPAPTMHGARAA